MLGWHHAHRFVGAGIAPVAVVCLQALAQMLVEVCKNPKNPGFNHYLFESVAALIKHSTAASPAMIETFEQMLFPAFNLVLQQVRHIGNAAVAATAHTSYICNVPDLASYPCLHLG